MRNSRAPDRGRISEEEAALRFDGECAKLDPAGERALAEKGLAADPADWPEY